MDGLEHKTRTSVPVRCIPLPPCPPSPTHCLCLLSLRPFPLGQAAGFSGEVRPCCSGEPRREGPGQPQRLAVWGRTTRASPAEPLSVPQGHWAGPDLRGRWPRSQTVRLHSLEAGPSGRTWDFLLIVLRSLHTHRAGGIKRCELSSLAKHLTFLWLQTHVPNTRVYI